MEVFEQMDYHELHKELMRLIKQSARTMRWFNVEKRDYLLPALAAMQKKVSQPGRRFPTSGMPDWQEECRLLGITAELVRKWKQRTASETDIRKMLGETEYQQHLKQKAPPSAELLQLQRLCEAVLAGEEKAAERIANRCAEVYGF
jgi:hypothetical protein